MSHLDELVKQWKDDLSHRESLQEDDLCELEQHLRDSVTELLGSGLSEDEAFLVASSRLGSVAALETEYRKVNGGLIWQRRVVWMLVGYVSLDILARLIEGVGSVAALFTAYAGASGTLMGFATILVSLLGWACLFRLMSGLAKNGDGRFIQHAQRMSPFVLVAISIGCILAGTLMPILGQGVVSRLVTVTLLGEAAFASAIGRLFLQIAIPTMCLFMIFSLKRELRVAA